MRLIGLDDIRRAAAPQLVFDAVRNALIAHAEGPAVKSAPIHMVFEDSEGDAHVKAGHVQGGSTFTVKLATRFYRNAAKGLPSNHGA